MQASIDNIIKAIPDSITPEEKKDLEWFLNHFKGKEEMAASRIQKKSEKQQSLLDELDSLFPKAGKAVSRELLLCTSVPERFKESRDFLAQYEVRENWRSIPHFWVYASHIMLLPTAEDIYFVLPAMLRDHIIDPTHSALYTILVNSRTEANKAMADLHLLNAEQRDFILGLCLTQRQSADKIYFQQLLPWEWQLYEQKSDNLRPAEWLYETYTNLWPKGPTRRERIEAIRAAIPTQWDEEEKDELNAFLDALNARMDQFHREEEKHPRDNTAKEKLLIEHIEQAFADVSDAGCHRLLLAGEAEEDYLSEAVQSLLSGFEIRGDWRNIPLEYLYACDSALYFVDAVAYRFLVPAFLRAEFLSYHTKDMVIALSSNEAYLDRDLELTSLFNDAQRAVLVDVMNYWRAKSSITLKMALLLPWEFAAYKEQSEHSSEEAWLRAQYLELGCACDQ